MPPAIPRLESLIAILDRSKKRLALAFGAALLLHFPLTPALPLLRLAHRLTDNKAETQPPPPQEVEVDLREAVRSEEKRIAQKAEPPPSKAAVGRWWVACVRGATAGLGAGLRGEGS